MHIMLMTKKKKSQNNLKLCGSHVHGCDVVTRQFKAWWYNNAFYFFFVCVSFVFFVSFGDEKKKKTLEYMFNVAGKEVHRNALVYQCYLNKFKALP